MLLPVLVTVSCGDDEAGGGSGLAPSPGAGGSSTGGPGGDTSPGAVARGSASTGVSVAEWFPDAPPDAQQILERASSLASQSRVLDAAKMLEASAIKGAESHRKALFSLAAVYYEKAKNPDATIRTAGEAEKRGSKVAPFLLAYGRALQKNSRLAEAEVVLRRLCDAHPEFGEGAVALAEVIFRLKDAESALPFFERYMKSPSADRDVHEAALREYARTLRAARRYSEAVDIFALLLERHPTDYSLYSELSRALYRMRKRSSAKFLESVYRELSQRDFDETVEERLIESGMIALALAQGALNLEERKLFLEAYRAYSRALSLKHNDSRPDQFFAFFLLRIERTKEAHETIRAAIDRGAKPQSGLWYWLGRVQIEQGQAAAARSSLQKSLEILKQEGDLGGYQKGQAPYFALGASIARVQVLEGQARSAVESFARLQGDPEAKRAEFLYWSGRASFESGDTSDAIPRLTAAAHVTAQGVDDEHILAARYYLALAHARAGDQQKARASAVLALRDDPSRIAAYEKLIEWTPDPAKQAQIRQQMDRAKGLVAQIAPLKKQLQEVSLEKAAGLYAKLGELSLRLKTAGGLDFLYLASDLDPTLLSAARGLVSRLKAPSQVFLRLRYFRRILEQEPENPPALFAFAEVYSKLHVRLKEAEKFAVTLQRVAPTAASFLVLGRVQSALGRVEDARNTWTAGLSKFPANPKLRAALDASQPR
ncbi:MAG: tetratricopeptide repeat protein [Planctomycetota bacterium]